MTKKDLIQSYKYFYRVITIEEVEEVLREGFKLNKYPDYMYDKQAPEKRPQICLSPFDKVEQHKTSTKQKSPTNQVAVFRISASVIADLDFGLDWTFQQTRDIYDPNNEPQSVKDSIDMFGTLSVYEDIPSILIERVE